MSQNYSRLIQKAILTIESDYMYIYNASQLADILGVTNSHLIREFTKNVGISLNKYLTSYKLSQSKILLSDDSLSIDAVALAVGFSCGNYYSKIFKKEFDITPTEYRKSCPVVASNKILQKMYL